MPRDLPTAHARIAPSLPELTKGTEAPVKGVHYTVRSDGKIIALKRDPEARREQLRNLAQPVSNDSAMPSSKASLKASEKLFDAFDLGRNSTTDEIIEQTRAQLERIENTILNKTEASEYQAQIEALETIPSQGSNIIEQIEVFEDVLAAVEFSGQGLANPNQLATLLTEDSDQYLENL